MPSFLTATEISTGSPTIGYAGSMRKLSMDAEITGTTRSSVISPLIAPVETLLSKISSALRVCEPIS